MNNGPRGRNNRSGLPNLKKFDKQTFKRLLKYILKNNKLKYSLVIICIIFSSIATVGNAIFLETLIDDHIEPLIGTPAASVTCVS